jgi:hypothetical protein
MGIPDANIRYDQSTQTVTIIDVGSSNGAIKLTVGSDIMSVVGGQVAMDVAPQWPCFLADQMDRSGIRR